MKNSNRVKLTAPQIATRYDIELLVESVAGAMNDQRALTAEMDAAIQLVRAKYSSRIEACAERIQGLTTVAKAWADENPEEFGKRKSIDLGSGTIGYRTGMPKLKTHRKWTWEKVLEALRVNKWGSNYIRLTEEIKKELIIADYIAEIMSGDELLALGMKVVQDESFFIQPKLTEVEKRAVAAKEAA